MQETSKKIFEAAKDHLLIAAHRGTAGGNIPCNTIQSYEAALLQGADIMEIDVSVSKDRKLFVFHPGMEPAHLRSSRYIKDMTADEVAQLRFVNQDGTPTPCPVSTLDEIFDLFKGRCFINVDKFWTAIPEITDCIRRHGMQDQVIVKTSPKEEWFKQIEDYAPE
ncbi:MAG: glycerophosphodiester phosphodiesterase family protein, partial [Victivallales bacterium]|nr:glycerophosphodiester phosphodiesterase family protein [Victivallales bacterium]